MKWKEKKWHFRCCRNTKSWGYGLCGAVSQSEPTACMLERVLLTRATFGCVQAENTSNPETSDIFQDILRTNESRLLKAEAYRCMQMAHLGGISTCRVYMGWRQKRLQFSNDMIWSWMWSHSRFFMFKT